MEAADPEKQPAADPEKPPSPTAAASAAPATATSPAEETPATKPPTFNAPQANALIAANDWKGLEDYLSSFVANFLGMNSQNVHMVHPGLFLIPREMKLLELLHAAAFKEGLEFFNESLKTLLKCETKFYPLDLKLNIDNLAKILDRRSVPSNRKSNEDVETAISDYIHLYFPSAIRQSEDELEGTWTFARKLPILCTGLKPWHGFKCLACGWTDPGKQSISALRYHMVHLDGKKGCPKVTQNMLDRLKAIDESKVVPDWSTLADPVKNNKRKAPSSSSASRKVTASPSATEKDIGAVNSSSLSAHCKNKKLKFASSPLTANTVGSSQATAPLSHGVDPNFVSHVSQSVTTLRSICNTLLDQVETSVSVSAQQHFVKKLTELMQVALDLQLASAEVRNVSAIRAISVHGQEPQGASQKAPAPGGFPSEAAATSKEYEDQETA